MVVGCHGPDTPSCSTLHCTTAPSRLRPGVVHPATLHLRCGAPCHPRRRRPPPPHRHAPLSCGNSSISFGAIAQHGHQSELIAGVLDCNTPARPAATLVQGSQTGVHYTIFQLCTSFKQLGPTLIISGNLKTPQKFTGYNNQSRPPLTQGH